eukprot:Hpha_TRINITY_DN16801_c3_g1::TRINITY_DN16801_c3_g1_i1::g.149536::m.149536
MQSRGRHSGEKRTAAAGSEGIERRKGKRMQCPRGFRSRRTQAAIFVGLAFYVGALLLISLLERKGKEQKQQQANEQADANAQAGQIIPTKPDDPVHVVKDDVGPHKTKWGYVLEGDPDYWSQVQLTCKLDREFTMDDIVKYSREENFLLTMRGIVLNVTNFIPHHPGGPAILGGAKRDCTEIFEGHHQPFVAGMISNFCVGKLMP